MFPLRLRTPTALAARASINDTSRQCASPPGDAVRLQMRSRERCFCGMSSARCSSDRAACTLSAGRVPRARTASTQSHAKSVTITEVLAGHGLAPDRKPTDRQSFQPRECPGSDGSPQYRARVSCVQRSSLYDADRCGPLAYQYAISLTAAPSASALLCVRHCSACCANAPVLMDNPRVDGTHPHSPARSSCRGSWISRRSG